MAQEIQERQQPELTDEEIHPSSRWTDEFPGFHCLFVNLPGFKKDDIKLVYKSEGTIVVSGRRKVDDKKEEHFEKTFNVPEDGDNNSIKSMLIGATLRVYIPKMVEEEINPSLEWTHDISGSYCFVLNHLPGFKKEDIKLNVGEDGIIVVSGKRKVGDGKRKHFEKRFNVPEDGDIKNIQMIVNEDTLRVLIPKMVAELINPSGWTVEYLGFHCFLVNLPGFSGDDIKLNVEEESGIIVVSGRRSIDNGKQVHFEKRFNIPEDGKLKNIQHIFNGYTLRVFIPKLVEEEINPSSGWTNDEKSHCLFLKLHGFKEDDIKLDVVDKHGTIEISGRRKVRNEKIEFFENTFNVPEDGDVENIQKVFEEDTLSVSIPKLVIEEINPSSSEGISDIPGYHCVLITLPGFSEDNIKLDVDKPGIITVSGRRKVDDAKQEHFEKTFNMPKGGSVENIQKIFDGNTLRVLIPMPVNDAIIPSSGWTNDTVGSHCLLVNLPAFKKDDMEMVVDKSGVIVVSGRRQVDKIKQEHFTKTFYVPNDGDMKNVRDTFEGDTLRVCIPKKTTMENDKPNIGVGASSSNTNNNNNDNDKKESNNISTLTPNEIPTSNNVIMDKDKDKEASSNIGALNSIKDDELGDSKSSESSNKTYWGIRALIPALTPKKKKKKDVQR